MKQKLIALVVLLICGVSAAKAQKISVEAFNRIDRDMGARVAKVRDINSDLCALIKIETIETGFEFSGCIIEKTEQKTGEIWVFVSPGVKFLTIKHKDFGVLRNYNFPQSIESGVVYQMKLRTKKEPQIDSTSISNMIDAKLEELNRKLAALEQAQSQQNNTHSQTTPNAYKEEQRNEPEKYSIANGYINDHEYVDLGLSVKWATCNVGANIPHGFGNYYAWGETETKSEYTRKNSKTNGEKVSDFSGDATYDVARANWGGTWRMPTKAEMQELLNNCTWTWTTQSGVNGYRVTGPNGNSIFLPAAGYCYGSSRSRVGEYGFYWSSTPYESDTRYAYYLRFYGGDRNVTWDYRSYGRTVRPVSE